MKSRYEVNLTIAHVHRHAPAQSQGLEAALVDIAQDLVLRHLFETSILDDLVFKGGTALRKLYAGNQGRFSLDLDFSVRDVGESAESVLELLVEEVQGLVLGPFTYGILERRGKRILTMNSRLGSTGQLTSKLDVNPPPWLEPTSRPWVPMAVHTAYGGPLPQLPCVRLEENVAEKIARLNRTTTARDVYDLVWIWQSYRRMPGTHLDANLVRRLAVLKIWVDANGLAAENTAWNPGHEAFPFEPAHWLRERQMRDFDTEDIGQLAVPAPDLDELASELRRCYLFLADLEPDERAIADLHGGHRPKVLRMIADLPGSRLPVGSCW